MTNKQFLFYRPSTCLMVSTRQAMNIFVSRLYKGHHFLGHFMDDLVGSFVSSQILHNTYIAFILSPLTRELGKKKLNPLEYP